MKKPLHLITAAACISLLAACAGHEGWTLNGEASDYVTIVYLEAPSADGSWYVADSVAPTSGRYTFELPRANQTIYRVTAGSTVFYVPADSTETIDIDAAGMRKGSVESGLFNAVDSVVRAGGDSRAMLLALNGHWASTAAYYATQLYPDSLTLLRTVTHRHKEEKPAAGRTQALQQRLEKLQKKLKKQSGNAETTVITAPITSYFDIELPDRNNTPQRLSDLVENNPLVILAFADFERPENKSLTMALGEAAEAGAAIYEVGFDANMHLWRNHSDNLPWVNVYQSESAPKNALQSYMVSSLPTLFIISNGTIVERVANPSDLTETIKRYI